MSPYRIEYGNDTGPQDDCFVEFWDVTNEDNSFRCKSEEEAEYLLKILSSQPELLELAIEQDEYYKKHYDAGILSDEAHEKWNRIKVIIKKSTE